jgi:MFS family permease
MSASDRRPAWRSWAFWAAIALTAASQAIYLGLSVSSLQKLDADSERRHKDLIVDRLGRRLEFVADLDVPLELYARLEHETRQAAGRSRSDFFAVFAPDGRVMAGHAPQARLNQPTGLAQLERGQFLPFRSSELDWRGRPVFDRQDRLAGLIGRTAAADSKSWRLALASAGPGWTTAIALSSLLTLLLVGLALNLGARRLLAGPMRQLRLYGLILGPFLVGQLLFSFFSISALFEHHLGQSRALAIQLAAELAVDIDRIMGQGARLEQLGGLADHLDSLRRERPLIEALSVRVGGLEIKSPAELPETSPELKVGLPLESGGQVQAWLSPAAVQSARLDLTLDNLSLTLVASLTLLEFFSLLTSGFKSSCQGQAPPANPSAAGPASTDGPGNPDGPASPDGPGSPAGPASTDGPGCPAGPVSPDRVRGAAGLTTNGVKFLRPMLFAALVGSDLSMSFVPLKMDALTSADTLLPREALLGLPIALEMGLASLSMFFGGRLARRFGGAKQLFTWGLAVMGLGSMLSGWAAWPAVFTAGRGLAGLGYGAVFMAAHFLASDATSPERRGEAMGDLAAGLYCGSLCGCLIGGLLADLYGFDMVLWAGAAIFGLLTVASALLLPAPTAASPESQPNARPGALGVFLRSRRVWAFGLLGVLPTGAALVGFLCFFLPLRLDFLGYGPAMVSRLNVLTLLTIVFLGPLCGRLADRSPRRVRWVVAASALSGLTACSLAVWPTLLGAMAAMALLGLSTAIAAGSHPSYLLNLKESESLGSRAVLSLYSTMNRVSRTLGPLATGTAWGLWGPTGLVGMGVAAIVAGLAMGPTADWAETRPDALPNSGGASDKQPRSQAPD